MNEVYELEPFRELYEKLDADEKRWIDKVEDQMRENLRVGDPLGYPFFREKKYENKRLYFFINEDTGKALVVAYGRKKDQQRMTKELKSDKEKYMDLIN